MPRLETPKPGLGRLYHFFAPDIQKCWVDPSAVRVSGDSVPNDSCWARGRRAPTGWRCRPKQDHRRTGVRAGQMSDSGITADDQLGVGDQSGQLAKIKSSGQDAVGAESSGASHGEATVTL